MSGVQVITITDSLNLITQVVMLASLFVILVAGVLWFIRVALSFFRGVSR